MQNPLTNAQLDFQCLKKAHLTSDSLKIQTRQPLFNTYLYKAYGYLDAVNHPFYNKTTVLTVAADQEQLYDAANNAGNITALDATAKTITRNIGVFVAGSIISVAEVLVATSQMVNSFIGLITIGGATATFKILSGGITTLSASYGLSVLVLKSQSGASADLDAHGIYFKKILAVYDGNFTTTPGRYNRDFDILTDEHAFANLSLDFGKQKRVGVIRLDEEALETRSRRAAVQSAKRPESKWAVSVSHNGSLIYRPSRDPRR